MPLEPGIPPGSTQEAVMYVYGLNGEVVADEAMLAAAEEQPAEPTPTESSTQKEA